MPIIFQQQLSSGASLAIWKITEPLHFFETKLSPARAIAHEEVKKRHLAARLTLQQLEPGLDLSAIKVAESGKPFFEGVNAFFSLSHTDQYAAAIVSSESQVGVDIEGVGERIFRIRHKYLDDAEQDLLQKELNLSTLQEGGDAAKWLTRCWSAKESIYKWHGQLGIDFIKDISLTAIDQTAQELHFNFAPTNGGLKINYHSIEKLELTWIEN